MKILTVEQMRDAERISDEKGVSYLKLMENAGTKLAENIMNLADEKNGTTVFLCGSGNNAGDCFVAADLMRKKGRKAVAALVSGIPSTEISSLMLRKAIEDGVTVTDDISEVRKILEDAACIVDGVFGTGFHGELSPELQELFSAGPSGAVRVAVDVPSGGNASSGTVSSGCFRADFTVTFGYIKTGMTQYPLREYCGEIITADIGLPEGINIVGIKAELLSDFSVCENMRKREAASHKGTYGTLVCVTGSASMPGASVLSAKAALRSGCGLVRMCTVSENTAALASAFPEAVYMRMKADEEGFYTFSNLPRILEGMKKASALLVGCGLGVTPDTVKLVRELIVSAGCPVILDADGIRCICEDPDIIKHARHGIILTPHPSEMSALTGKSVSQIQSDRFKACSDFISQYPDAVLVLKGAGTLIGYRDMISVSPDGNPGMSCAGSGDVLSGIIASVVAQGMDIYKAALLGVTIHGRAGDTAAEKYSMYSMLPSDIISGIGNVFLNEGNSE